MTRDEAVNYLTLNKPASGYPGLCEAIDMAIDALRRAPAVTGEADSVTRYGLRCASCGKTFDSVRLYTGGGSDWLHDVDEEGSAACGPVMADLPAAPPAAGAPPALVALVQEWQQAKRHVDALNEDGGGPSPEAFSAACDHIDEATRALLAWSPAPAPVAPPAVAWGDAPYCRECGADGSRVAYVEQHADSEEWRCKNCGQTFSWRRQEGQ